MKILDILSEVDYADALGNLAISDQDLIQSSAKDGSIGSRPVYHFDHSPEQIFFFENNRKIDALVYLSNNNELMGIKNFTNNRGLIFNLFQYIVNMKGHKVMISPINKLTKSGIDWICDQNDRNGPFTIRDLDGNRVDSKALRDEWDTARQNRKNGPTGLSISESYLGESLRSNESRLMPMDIYGATLTNLSVSISEDLNNIFTTNTLRTRY